MMESPGQPGPLRGTYWVRPDRLLVGPYPGGWAGSETRRLLRSLLEAGVTLFVDLTEPGEVDSYLLALAGEAKTLDRAAHHLRFAIPDMAVPSDDLMIRILDSIDAALADGKTVYVHCLGGIGRTGTVVGCFLVRHGMAGDDALAAIIRKRGGLLDSPQTDEQAGMVRAWRAGR